MCYQPASRQGSHCTPAWGRTRGAGARPGGLRGSHSHLSPHGRASPQLGPPRGCGRLSPLRAPPPPNSGTMWGPQSRLGWGGRSQDMAWAGALSGLPGGEPGQEVSRDPHWPSADTARGPARQKPWTDWGRRSGPHVGARAGAEVTPPVQGVPWGGEGRGRAQDSAAHLHSAHSVQRRRPGAGQEPGGWASWSPRLGRDPPTCSPQRGLPGEGWRQRLHGASPWAASSLGRRPPSTKSALQPAFQVTKPTGTTDPRAASVHVLDRPR